MSADLALIVSRQKHGGGASIRLRDHPQLLSGLRRIDREQAETVLQGELILSAILFAHFAPVGTHVPNQEIQWTLPGPLHCLQCPRSRDDPAEGELLVPGDLSCLWVISCLLCVVFCSFHSDLLHKRKGQTIGLALPLGCGVYDSSINRLTSDTLVVKSSGDSSSFVNAAHCGSKA